MQRYVYRISKLDIINDTNSEGKLRILRNYSSKHIMSRASNSYQEFLTSTLTIPSLPEAPLNYVLNNCNIQSGIAVELGVYSGTTLQQIVKKFSGEVHGFDSFEGLPERWDRSDMTFDKGAFDLKGELPTIQGATLHKGWFSETLPEFVKNITQTISLLHVDCDLYSSTKESFQILGPYLSDNAIIVFDELLDYPNYDKNEMLALYEFMKESKLKFDWIGKYGNIRMNPEKDRGAIYQAAVIRIVK